MENISLILSDLDGTLFRDDKTISDYTKEIIAAAQKKGILFGISTSRARTNVLNFLEGISPDILITNGGGLATLKGQKIYSCEFSIEETQALLNAALDVMGDSGSITIDNENGLYSNSKENLSDKFWTYNDFTNFSQSCMKLCVETLDKEKVAAIAERSGIQGLDIHPFSDIPWSKLSKSGATKERAIQELRSNLNIPQEKIAAFGDDFNDIGMLKFCGRGIAMQNAIAEVKQIADEICASNQEDGVAHWIERLL